MEVILFFGFISALVCGITSTKLANSKGGHALGWFCIGFFLNILGIAVLVASPYNQENLDKKGVKDRTRKYCPHCSEIVRRAALKCRYCASDLEVGEQDKIA